MKTIAAVGAILRQNALAMRVFATVNGARCEGKIQECAFDASTGRALWHVHSVDGLEDELSFQLFSDHIRVHRKIRNISDEVLCIQEIGLTFADMQLGENPAKDYFYHLENPRIYEKLCIPVDYDRVNNYNATDFGFDAQAGNRWADPGTVNERIGRSPYQAFPAILLSNLHSPSGLVHGTLSQKVFYHCYEVRHCGKTLELDAFSAFKGTAYRELAPGEILEDSFYLGVTEYAGDIERCFAGYADVLRKVLPVGYGASDINRHTLVWGSWNDGIFRDVYEKDVIEVARYLKKEFPTVEWIQLDDGYAKLACEHQIAHGLGMPYEGDEGIDADRFPNGLKHYTDAVRQTGLRPAIWIGGFCPKVTPIYQEHPEWFIDYDYRVTASAPLDVSKVEVREYIQSALDKLITEYGFEGVKHDFWSYAFEDSGDLLSEKYYSGYELREWFLVQMREHIQSDGYLQTGCDIVMGNPFLGKHFSNYRYGIDIGNGNWDYVRTNFLWGAACFATHTGDLFVPNSDSIGLFPGLTDIEANFCLDYCLVTRSMVEIAGYLHREPNHPRMKALRKTAACPNNGEDVYFAGFDYRSTHRAPEVMFLKSAHFSLLRDREAMPCRTAGVFNLSDGTAERSFTRAALDLAPGDYLLTDVHSGESVAMQEDNSFTLPAHGSRLFTVTAVADGSPALLDADVKLSAIKREGNTLTLAFAFDAEVEMFFSAAPVCYPGHMTLSTGSGNWILCGKVQSNTPFNVAF